MELLFIITAAIILAIIVIILFGVAMAILTPLFCFTLQLAIPIVTIYIIGFFILAGPSKPVHKHKKQNQTQRK